MSGVFLTGGSGFIGGRLIERLRGDGHAELRAG
jgi:nucleoside-diphosphate-sugar epimerase